MVSRTLLFQATPVLRYHPHQRASNRRSMAPRRVPKRQEQYESTLRLPRLRGVILNHPPQSVEAPMTRASYFQRRQACRRQSTSARAAPRGRPISHLHACRATSTRATTSHCAGAPLLPFRRQSPPCPARIARRANGGSGSDAPPAVMDCRRTTSPSSEPCPTPGLGRRLVTPASALPWATPRDRVSSPVRGERVTWV